MKYSKLSWIPPEPIIILFFQMIQLITQWVYSFEFHYGFINFEKIICSTIYNKKKRSLFEKVRSLCRHGTLLT